ncbi:hypothetical protein [Pseudomonas violetae]|uniref:Uncharacterized protein n=1 Tax=Pseudomonas violetae TaxID=2915813 RepID=A0ABT0ESJ9_9PSED|nr:hypothetical protein [Pseudomonas violetae]MCK1788706.1 hypothetical protein [Pseudomonas violetae]
MKSFSNIALCALAICTASAAIADEADQVLDRQKTLNAMEFKRDQLKFQAEMAKFWKEMSDSNFIVDTDGNPLGIENIQELGIQVRKQGRPGDGNPFQAGTPLAPNAMPFMLDQPPTAGSMPPSPGSPFSQQQRPPMPGAATGTAQKDLAPVEEIKKVLSLKQIRGDSVTFRTNEGDRVLRVGEKVYDLTLTRFDVDRAWLKGPKGTQVVAIDWTNPKRYAED